MPSATCPKNTAVGVPKLKFSNFNALAIFVPVSFVVPGKNDPAELAGNRVWQPFVNLGPDK